MYVLVFLLHLTITMAHFEITTIPNNPGLYFQHLGKLHLPTIRYVTKTEIDLQKISLDFANTLGRLSRTFMDCPSEPTLHLICSTRYSSLSQKQTKAYDLWEQILAYTNSTPPYPTIKNAYTFTNGITPSAEAFQKAVNQFEKLERTPNISTDARWNFAEGIIAAQTQIYETLIDTIRSILNQRITPRLIPFRLLKDIEAHVQQQHQHPKIPDVNVYSLDFQRTARVNLFKQNSVLIVEIIFSLFSSAFDLYKIYPVLVPQNNKMSAIIDSPYQYIAQDSENNLHFRFNDNNHCFRSNKNFYCLLTPIINKAHTCESSILNNFRPMNWSLCKINRQLQHFTQWIILEEQEGFLFSAPRSENVTIKCHENPVKNTTLYGLGILRMNTNCQAITPDHILPMQTSIIRKRDNKYFEPSLQLNLEATEVEVIKEAVHNIKMLFAASLTPIIITIILITTYVAYQQYYTRSFNLPETPDTYVHVNTIDTDTQTTDNINTDKPQPSETEFAPIIPQPTTSLPPPILKPLPSIDKMLMRYKNIIASSDLQDEDSPLQTTQ